MSLLFPSRLLPKAAMLIGFAGMLGAAGMAVSHFRYGQPVYDRHTHRPVSDRSVIFTVILFGTVGCAVSGLGIRALVAPRREDGGEGDE